MDLINFLHITLESGLAMFCIMAAIYLRLYDSVSPKVVRITAGILLINAVVNLADALTYVYGRDQVRINEHVIAAAGFVVIAGMLVMLAACCMLLETVLAERGGGKDKRLPHSVYAICAAGFLVPVVSLFTGLSGSSGLSNPLYSTSDYLLVTIAALAALVLLIWRTVSERGVLGKRIYRLFLCLWLIPAVGAAAQYFCEGISLADLANSTAILIFLFVFMRDAVAEMSIRKSFILTPASIDGISDEIDGFLNKIGTERQNRIRIRFTAEDALMRFREHFGDPSMVRVTAGIKFGKPYIKIDHEGDPFNPFSKTHNTIDEWSSGLLSSAGLSPAYSYSHGVNSIKISLGRLRINPIVTIVIAILFGLILGSVANATLAGGDETFVTQQILMPVYTMWNNMLYSIAAPAMLVIVMSTMLDTRDVSEQGGNAGLITGRYFVVSILIGIVTFAAAVAVVPEAFGTEMFTRDTIAELIQKLLGIIPGNLLDPFRDFNTAQLILMGIVFAYAIMAVGQPAAGIAKLIHQLNAISAQLAQWIAVLMPFFTVLLTAQLVMEHNGGLLLGLFNILPFSVAVSLICVAVVMVYICRSMHMDMRVLLKKLWPSFALTFKSGQVADSYALAEQCCTKDLGIQKIFTENVLPLGLVLYMPVSMVGMTAFVIYAAYKSAIVITPVWMITAVIFALILLVAAPPIPGINLLSYVVIIEQLGIGREYVLAAMIFDIIFNVFASAANQMMLQGDIILQADRVGLLNHKILRK